MTGGVKLPAGGKGGIGPGGAEPPLGGNGGGPSAIKVNEASVKLDHGTHHLGRHLEGAFHREGKVVHRRGEAQKVGKVVDLYALRNERLK